MEVINYNKTKCILNNIVHIKLKEIFKQRWYIESNKSSEWIDNPAHAIYIKNSIQSFNSLSEKEKGIIERGHLSEFTVFIFCSCLLNFQFKVVKNNKKFKDQNNSISKINEINNKALEISNFSISNEQFLEYKETLLDCVFTISCCKIKLKGADNDLKLLKNQIKQDFEYTLNTLQEGEYNGIIFKMINQENEKLSKSFIDKGMEEFIKNNETSIKKSVVLFNNALLYKKNDGLSNKTISEIHIYISNSEFKYKVPDIKSISPDKDDINMDYTLIKNSKSNCLLSLVHRPSWYKPYFQLGEIFSRLGQYERSIQFLDAAIILVNQFLDQPLSSKESIEKFKTTVTNKLKFKSGCNSVKVSTELGKPTIIKRDFDKEARATIKQFGDLIKTRFQHLKITDQFIKQEGIISKSLDLQLYKVAQITGLPKSQFVEGETMGRMQQKLSLKDTEFSNAKAVEYTSRCIGNGTKLAQPFLNLAEQSTSGLGIEYNEPLIMSLYLYASLLPTSFNLKKQVPGKEKEIKEYNYAIASNYFTVIAQTRLGMIYRFGMFGQDIDLEKSVYYFEKAINNDKNPNEFNRECSGKDTPYSYLGLMYNNGIVPNGVVNTVKAKELWTMGGELGDRSCVNLLLDDNTDFLSSLLTTFTSIIGINDKEPNGKFKTMADSNSFRTLGKRFFMTEIYQLVETLDFNEIKNQFKKSEKSNLKSYLSVVYKAHINVVSFLNKFNQYQLDCKNGLISSKESKFEIIKFLANAYRSFDALFVVRIPQNKLQDILQFVNQILEIDQLNIDARIISIGLNGSEANFVDGNLLKFIRDSLELYKNEQVNLEITFYNFQHSFYNYLLDDNSIQKIHEYAMDLNGNFKDQPSKIHIFQIMCKSLSYIGFENLKSTIQIDQFFLSLIEISEFYMKSLPSDHPYICEMYYYLALILVRLCMAPNLKNQQPIFKVPNMLVYFFRLADQQLKLLSPIFLNRLDSIQDLKTTTSNTLGLYSCYCSFNKNED